MAPSSRNIHEPTPDLTVTSLLIFAPRKTQNFALREKFPLYDIQGHLRSEGNVSYSEVVLYWEVLQKQMSNDHPYIYVSFSL